MDKQLLKRYGIYIGRWQLSTPSLAIVVWLMSGYNIIISTIIANFIGALIFFWVDKRIFGIPIRGALWDVVMVGKCHDCSIVGKVLRLVKTRNYDRLYHKHAEYRCENCSQRKLRELRNKGVESI